MQILYVYSFINNNLTLFTIHASHRGSYDLKVWTQGIFPMKLLSSNIDNRVSMWPDVNMSCAMYQPSCNWLFRLQIPYINGCENDIFREIEYEHGTVFFLVAHLRSKCQHIYTVVSWNVMWMLLITILFVISVTQIRMAIILWYYCRWQFIYE